MILIMSSVSSEEAWFHKQHDWDANDSNNQQSKADFHLLLQCAYVANSIFCLRFTKVEDSVDHDIDDGWAVLIDPVTL
jgi:hypothetical protein